MKEEDPVHSTPELMDHEGHAKVTEVKGDASDTLIDIIKSSGDCADQNIV